MRHAENALTAEPHETDYIILVAWVRAAKGEPGSVEAAVETMNQVLSSDVKNARALLYRGRLFARLGRSKEALGDFKAILATNPNHREAQAEIRQMASRLPSG